LFIGITEALPQQVSLIGLDLSGKPEVFGWFLLCLTAYFLIISLVLAILDLIKYYLPYFIKQKGANVTGDSLGLTEYECQYFGIGFDSLGEEDCTVQSELRDIQSKRKKIELNYHSRYVKLFNFAKLLIDLIFPIAFSAVSIIIIHRFLK